MGTRCRTDRESRKSAADLHKRSKQHNGHSRGAGARTGRSALFENAPKAGMTYPFERTLTRRNRSDAVIANAIKKGMEASLVTRALLEDAFSPMFEGATEMLRDGVDAEFRDNPIALIEKVRARPGVREVWLRCPLNTLSRVFLILRAARQNWHKNPRLPLDVAQHGKTAKAIDGFLAVDDLNWGGLAMIEWLLHGGLNLGSFTAHKGESESESDGETGMFVKQTCPVPPDDDEEIADPNNAVEDSDNRRAVDGIVDSMRRLNIDIDRTALTEAFAKLRIKDQSRPAPRRNGYPFIDDEDEDEDLDMIL